MLIIVIDDEKYEAGQVGLSVISLFMVQKVFRIIPQVCLEPPDDISTEFDAIGLVGKDLHNNDISND